MVHKTKNRFDLDLYYTKTCVAGVFFELSFALRM